MAQCGHVKKKYIYSWSLLFCYRRKLNITILLKAFLGIHAHHESNHLDHVDKSATSKFMEYIKRLLL